jgi:hypothetical protein
MVYTHRLFFSFLQIPNQSAAPAFLRILDTQPLAPFKLVFFGQMYNVEEHTSLPEQLQKHLFGQFKIKITIKHPHYECFMQFYFQAFNRQEEMEYLTVTIHKIRKAITHPYNLE